MLVSEIMQTLEAKALTGADNLDREIKTACGADLMSDVLAFVKDDTALLTGLVNTQVIRTAEMLDVTCIVFVRGKIPTPDILDMAQEQGIVVLSTEMTLYTACGELFKKGLPGSSRNVES